MNSALLLLFLSSYSFNLSQWLQQKNIFRKKEGVRKGREGETGENREIFSAEKEEGIPTENFGKRALTQTGISLSQKNNFSTENPARFLRQVSYTGLEFFRKERRQCQTVRIPGATWMTSSSIRKTAGQASDKRKPCGNAGPHRQFFFFCLLNAESAKAVHGFLDFLFRGCFCGTPLN